MKSFELAQPGSLDAAIRASGESFVASRWLAGGTDLLATIKERVDVPERLVNLKTIPDLASIEVTAERTVIGALATHTEVAEHVGIREHHPALVEAILATATPQIRNVATIGGGLCQRPRCWYFRHPDYPCRKKGGATCYAQEGENEFHTIFDNGTCCAVHASNIAPILLAYDAVLIVRGSGGEREVALDDFFVDPDDNVMVENILAPGELITRIEIPAAARGWGEAYVEVREKQSFDWALTAATVLVKASGGAVEDSRVVVSAVAPRPLRLPRVEALLRGRVDEDALSAAGEAACAGATPLEQNGYKLALVRATIARAARSAISRARKG